MKVKKSVGHFIINIVKFNVKKTHLSFCVTDSDSQIKPSCVKYKCVTTCWKTRNINVRCEAIQDTDKITTALFCDNQYLREKLQAMTNQSQELDHLYEQVNSTPSP